MRGKKRGRHGKGRGKRRKKGDSGGSCEIWDWRCGLGVMLLRVGYVNVYIFNVE